MSEELAAAVRDLFGPGVAVAAADPRAPATGLLPEETAPTGRMIEKRHREFAAGRRAARAAMTGLGLPAVAIPMGPDRAPVWPEGVTGSISHTDTHCLAAVARTGEVRALGLDLEPDMALEPALWPDICTGAELDWLEARPAPEPVKTGEDDDIVAKPQISPAALGDEQFLKDEMHRRRILDRVLNVSLWRFGQVEDAPQDPVGKVER